MKWRAPQLKPVQNHFLTADPIELTQYIVIGYCLCLP